MLNMDSEFWTWVVRNGVRVIPLLVRCADSC